MKIGCVKQKIIMSVCAMLVLCAHLSVSAQSVTSQAVRDVEPDSVCVAPQTDERVSVITHATLSAYQGDSETVDDDRLLIAYKTYVASEQNVTTGKAEAVVRRPQLVRGALPWYIPILFERILPRLFNASVLAVSGTEHLDSIADTPAIFTYNHPSLLDSLMIRIVLYSRYHRYVHPVARVKRLGYLHMLLQSIVLRPEGEGGTTNGMISTLQKGKDISIAPRGYITRGEEEHFDSTQWRSGLIYSARIAQVPIVPVVLEIENSDGKRGRQILWELVLAAYPWLQRLGVFPPFEKYFYTPTLIHATLAFGEPRMVGEEVKENTTPEAQVDMKRAVFQKLSTLMRGLYRSQPAYEKRAFKSA